MKSYEEQLREVMRELSGGDPTPLPEYTITASEYEKIEKQEERKRLRDSWKRKKQFPR